MALFQSTANAADTDVRINGLMGFSDVRPRPEAELPLGRDSSVFTQVVWIFFWLFILIIVAYPLAMLAAILYVIMNPFSLMGDCMKVVKMILLNMIDFPLTCAQNMADAKQLIAM